MSLSAPGIFSIPCVAFGFRHVHAGIHLSPLDTHANRDCRGSRSGAYHCGLRARTRMALSLVRHEPLRSSDSANGRFEALSQRQPDTHAGQLPITSSTFARLLQLRNRRTAPPLRIPSSGGTIVHPQFLPTLGTSGQASSSFIGSVRPPSPDPAEWRQKAASAREPCRQRSPRRECCSNLRP